jgi:hypothetical protein
MLGTHAAAASASTPARVEHKGRQQQATSPTTISNQNSGERADDDLRTPHTHADSKLFTTRLPTKRPKLLLDMGGHHSVPTPEQDDGKSISNHFSDLFYF